MKRAVILFLLTALVIEYTLFFRWMGRKTPNEIRISRQTPVKTFGDFISSQIAIEKPTYRAPVPTLDTIFSDSHTWIATLSAERVRTMIATGDVIPARSVNFQTTSRGDFTWPFAKTAQLLADSDITHINLETPLLQVCPTRTDGMIFCGDRRHVEGLTLAGVDVAAVANNHAGNWGAAGVIETKALLESKGITVSGSDNQPVYKDIRGLRFAFLAYNDIGYKENMIAWADTEAIKKQVHEARSNSSVVVVSYHWGPEYVRQPASRQIELAHLTVDAGADVVLGNHPHWIQPVELYKGKFIIYAHGNFVFDQEWSAETKLGVVGKYTFYDEKLIDVEYFPVRIVDYGQPYFLTGAEKSVVLKILKDASSERLGTSITRK